MNTFTYYNKVSYIANVPDNNKTSTSKLHYPSHACIALRHQYRRPQTNLNYQSGTLDLSTVQREYERFFFHSGVIP